eukprot:364743-Chlamydomonas_euryale.AAC.80
MAGQTAASQTRYHGPFQLSKQQWSCLAASGDVMASDEAGTQRSRGGRTLVIPEVAFYNELKDISAIDLFDDDRLTLGWTEQERNIEHVTVRVHLEGCVLQLVEAIETMWLAHDSSHVQVLADVEASRKQSEASDKRADVIQNPVERLDRYQMKASLRQLRLRQKQ